MNRLYDDEDLLLCDSLGVNIEAGEVLAEMATVARSEALNLSLAVNPDSHRNLQGKPYFKVYNHTSPAKATQIARINFYRCEYIIHHANRGKKNWDLNAKDKDKLMKLLKSPSKRDEGYTVWQSLIISFNYELGLDPEKTKRNFRHNLLYRGYLPINLPIPDYDKNAFYKDWKSDNQ